MPDHPEKPENFWQKFKRRKIIQVVIKGQEFRV